MLASLKHAHARRTMRATPHGAAVRVRSWGQGVIEVGRGAIATSAERTFAVILYLAVERGKSIDRDSLAQLMWPHLTSARRRHALRQLLYRLRRVGAPTVERLGIVRLPRECVWLDFEDDSGQIARNDDDEYDARFLPRYSPRISPAFTQWLEEVRLRANAVTRRALARHMLSARRAGRWTEVALIAQRCLSIDTLDEEATVALAEAYAEAGDVVNAEAALDSITDDAASRLELRVRANEIRSRVAAQRAPRGQPAFRSPLVGRTELVTTLTSALHQARSGVGSIHCIWGPAGVGKTRILDEIDALASAAGAATVRLTGGSAESSLPLECLLRWLPALHALPGALGVSPAAHAILAGHGGAVAHLALAEEPTARSWWSFRVERALIELLDAVMEEQAVVVLIDDAQFVDQETLRLTHRAFASRTGRMVVVEASRNRGTIPEQWQGAVAHQVRPLDFNSAAELIDNCAAVAGVSAGERQTLVDIANGLPRHLHDTIEIFASNSGDRAAAERRLSDWMRRHLESVPPSALHVLCALSIGAGAQTVPSLAAAMQCNPWTVALSLDQLIDKAVVRIDENGHVLAHTLWLEAAERVAGAAVVGAARASAARALERNPIVQAKQPMLSRSTRRRARSTASTALPRDRPPTTPS